MARPPLEVGTYSHTITAKPYTSDGALAAKGQRGVAYWAAQGTARKFDGTTVRLKRRSSTKVGAERSLRDALEAAVTSGSGLGTYSPTDTLRTLTEAWLAYEAETGRLAATSLQTYTNALKPVTAHLGALTMGQLTAPRIEAGLRAIAKERSNNVAKSARKALQGVCKFAVYNGAIGSNPMLNVPLVMVEGRGGTPARARAIPDATIRAMLEVADPDLADLIAFLAQTGVRIGEALAVKWEDVNFEAQTVYVGHSTVARLDGVGLRLLEHGATKAHPRTISLSDGLTERLRARLAGQWRDNPHGVVFVNELGGSLRDPRNTTRAIKQLGESVGEPWITAHNFRDTVATKLLDGGALPRDVAAFLGHSDVTTTFKRYLGEGSSDSTDLAKALEL